MTDPYETLGKALVEAASRREARGGARHRRAWLSRRLNVVTVAVLLVLAGAAVAVAASGLLSGSPVAEPQGVPTSNSGTGVPTVGGAHLLALRAADPEGGPPWGMRLVHTTRGELCVQIGRVQDGQLGQLGIDGAFHDDGLFHPLSVDTLPNYTNGYADLICLLPGEVMMGEASTEDRNAEWGVGPKPKPSAQRLRSISWGLLGSHAVSVTYRAGAGSRTIPVSPGSGAYMIVQPVRRVPARVTIGGFETGSIVGHEVGIEPPGAGRDVDGSGAVRTIVYRFGSLVCSVGTLAPDSTRCPAPPPIPINAYRPTRSLNERVRVTLVSQSHAICNAAYLLDPCYRAEVAFRAPYAVTSAASEYSVTAKSSCHNATPSSWPIDRDVSREETVRSLSLGEFNCTADSFEVSYRDFAPRTSSPRSGPESVIVGTGTLDAPGVVH
jgi:hypothetical protein